MAWPRLARVPVKHDRTPMVTGPVGSLPEEVVLLPQAAITNTAATELATRRQGPDGRRLTVMTFLRAKSSSRFGRRLVQPRWLVNGWTTRPMRLVNSAAMPPSAAALRPIERSRRLYEDVGERLGDFVRESSMKPGDQFPAERELAQRLQVSR